MKKNILYLLLWLFTSSLYAQAPYLLTDNDVRIENGEIKDYFSHETNILIPPYLNGQLVTSIGTSAFFNNQLSAVTIPNTITYIGDEAFKDNNLSTINIPNTITYIGTSAFSSNSLTSITIPNSITSIGDEVFKNNNLSEVIIPNTVAKIGNEAFSFNNLASINIPNSVIRIGTNAFINNTLTSFTLPSPAGSGIWTNGESGLATTDLASAYEYWFDSYTAKDEDFTFKDGEILKYNGQSYGEVIIPALIDGQVVTSIGQDAFFRKNITAISIPNSVTHIGRYSFYECKLTNITIPNSVTHIGARAFYKNQLTNATIPNSVTNIGEYAFYYNNLTSVTIPNSVTNIDSYSFCQNQLNNVTIPNSVINIGSYAFYNNNLTSITIPNSVTTIGEGAFSHNSLSSVTIPSSVTAIKASAFYNNTLTTISLPNSVTTIDKNAFSHNILSSVTIPNSITTIESAFNNNRLTSVSIPNSVTIIGGGAFANNNLTSVSIPNSVTIIGDHAFSSNSLSSVTIPNSATTIGEYAFYNNQLNSITIPNSVYNIGSNAFINNNFNSFILPSPASAGTWDNGEAGVSTSNLSLSYNYTCDNYLASNSDFLFENGEIKDYYGPSGSIIIPSTIDAQTVTSVGQSAFRSNRLRSVSIPNSVTTIGANAFSENVLTSVTIPNSVTNIGSSAFYLNQLTNVIIPNSVTTIGYGAFQSNSLASITIPNSVTHIGRYAFYNNVLVSFVLPTPSIPGVWDNGQSGIETNELNLAYEFFPSNYVAVDEDFLFENGVILDYYGPIGTVIIPSTINGQTVTSIGHNAFNDKKLSNVVLPNTITSIGNSAFSNNNIKSIGIPSSVSTIGAYAFNGNKLSVIAIPNSVISIGTNAFSGNYLNSITLPSPADSGAWSSGEAGARVTNLGISYTYYYTNYLGTDEDFSFENGVILEYNGPPGELIIPERINNQLVTTIGRYAFSHSNLNSVTIPNSVTTIDEYAFKSNNLTSITIPGSVITIGRNAFHQNELTSVTLPNSLTTIGEYCFYDNNLEDVTIPDSVTKIEGWAFSGNNIRNVSLPNSITFIGRYAFYNSSYRYSIFQLPAPTIAGEWDNGNPGDWISNMTISYTYLYNNYVAVDEDFLFENGEILDYYGPSGGVVIPSTINGQSVTSIGIEAFRNKKIKNVTIPSTVTTIKSSAFNANSLNSISLPNSITTIGDYAFGGNNLTSVSIPNSVTKLGKCAFYYNQLTSIIIGNSVTTIGESAFSNNILSDVTIPNSVTYIGSSAFSQNSLSGFYLPSPQAPLGCTLDGWKTPNDVLYSAGSYTFDFSSTYMLNITEYNAFMVSVLLEGATGNLKIEGDQSAIYNDIKSANIMATPGQNLSLIVSAPGYRIEPGEIAITNIQDDVMHTFTSEIIDYSITYNMDGGIAANPHTYNVETATISLTPATKEHYIFEGWFTEESFVNETTEIIQGSTGSIELFAKWSPETFNITYVLDGGTHNNVTTYSIETPTIVLTAATKENYIFEGWYTEDSFVNEITEIIQGSTGSIELYAKWSIVLSTDNLFTNNKVQIYPNPTKGEINIIIDGIVPEKISLFNLQGALIKELPLLKNQTVNLNIATGIYILSIKGNGKKIQKRIVIH